MKRLALALCLSIVACSKPEPPTLRPVSAEVKQVSPKGIDLKMQLDAQNPNSVPLSVRRVSGKLLVGSGVEVGTAGVDTSVRIPAKGTQRVASDLTVSWTNLAAIAPLATTGKPVPYTFEGLANVGGDNLNMDVPFRLSGQLTQAQLVQIGLSSLPSLPGVLP